MYIKQKQANFVNRFIAISIIVIIAMFAIMFTRTGENRPDNVQTIVALEIYRNYSVERYNGKVQTVYVDTDVYSVNYCNEYTMNDEGHNCVLNEFSTIWKFLTDIGY